MDETYTVKEDSKYSLGFKMTASSSIDLHYAKAEDAIIALKVGADVLEKLEWLGLFSSRVGPKKISGTPAEIIQSLIEEKWELKSSDRDMIVMWHRFVFEKDGVLQEITSELALEGADPIYTAMSDTVGLPMALAAEHILSGPGFVVTGVQVPVTPVFYEPMLAQLEKLGIAFIEKHCYV